METVKKGNVTITRESREQDENSVIALRQMMDAGAKIRPIGTQLIGFATVYFYQNTDSEGGAFKCLTKVSHIPEKFVDGGIKDLARHCMKQFGRTPPKEG